MLPKRLYDSVHIVSVFGAHMLLDKLEAGFYLILIQGCRHEHLSPFANCS